MDALAYGLPRWIDGRHRAAASTIASPIDEKCIRRRPDALPAGLV